MLEAQTREVYYFPVRKMKNPYNQLQIQLLQRAGFRVRPLSELPLMGAGSARYAVLNWLEFQHSKEQGEVAWVLFFKMLGVLIYVWLSRTPIIWVKHNRRPHAKGKTGAFLSRILMRILESLAVRTVVHSPTALQSPQCRFAPHPLYPVMHPGLSEKTFSRPLRFGCIGRLMPYKGFDRLLEIWPPCSPLRIWGQGATAYVDKLNELIRRRGLQVEIDNRFVADEDIPALLTELDVMVLAHVEETAIVSGVFYLAKSAGCLMLTSRADFADAYSLYFKGTAESLEDAMKSLRHLAATHTRQSVQNAALAVHGDEPVMAAWTEILLERL